MEIIGMVIWTIDRVTGEPRLYWRRVEGKEPLSVRNGERYIVKYRGTNMVRVTIGIHNELERPVSWEWLQREILPGKGELLNCELYKEE